MDLHVMIDPDDVPSQVHKDAAEAVLVNADRLSRAAAADDVEQVVGASKDLVECVAKVALDALGRSYGSNEDLPKLAKDALDALGLHPRAYQGRPPIQRMTGALSGLPAAVAELRNQDGTGHGRVNLTDLRVPSAQLAAAAAVAWSRWVLAAVGVVLQDLGRVNEAIDAIQESVFYRGGLPRLLSELPLTDLDDSEQHRLGLAVARRWADGGTFLALEDVIEPLAGGTADFPTAFTRGVLEGLLLNARGNLRMTADTVKLAGRILEGLDGEALADVHSAVLPSIQSAAPTYALNEQPDDVLAALAAAARTATHPEAAGVFRAIHDRLQTGTEPP